MGSTHKPFLPSRTSISSFSSCVSPGAYVRFYHYQRLFTACSLSLTCPLWLYHPLCESGTVLANTIRLDTVVLPLFGHKSGRSMKNLVQCAERTCIND